MPYVPPMSKTKSSNSAQADIFVFGFYFNFKWYLVFAAFLKNMPGEEK